MTQFFDATRGHLVMAGRDVVSEELQAANADEVLVRIDGHWYVGE